MGRVDKNLLDDDIDEAINDYNKKKRKRKRRRKRRTRLVVLILIALTVFYFVGDLSKVKQLRVVGNSIYSQDAILDLSKVSYETRYVVAPEFWIKSNVMKGEFIEDVKVHKTWDGSIRIEVQEVDLAGYYINASGETLALTRDGRTISIAGAQLSLISKYPLLHGFSDESLISLSNGLNFNEPVTKDMIQQISEITPYQTSYDSSMVKVTMRDGNKLYTTMESLYLLNGYSILMQKETRPNQCYFVEGVNRSYNNLPCDSF